LYTGCRKDYFFSKKYWKYCDGVLKYFTMFAQEKLQKNKTYFANILVQITVTGCRKDYFFQKNPKNIAMVF
jgi:hypothetical protein